MAAPFTDRIGQRLDDPASVPAEYQHLIADDRQRAERILSFPVSGRILDVGCSDGAITKRIAEKWGVEAVGADNRCGHGKEFWASSQKWISVPWDVRTPWPHADGLTHELWKFDAVYACEVFEHLTDADAQKALANILAVLKPGGDLIVTVPNRYCDDKYVAGCRDRWRWPDHRAVYSQMKLELMLGPRFERLDFVPLYDGEPPDSSIWLIARAGGKW